jgi:uncharacterized membrane protein
MGWYLGLKLVHILSGTLLLGTGLGIAFFMWRADRSRDVRAIAVVSRNVVLADCWFTAPAVVIQPATGFGLLHITGVPVMTPWVVASLVIYLLVGACWLPVVWLQLRVAALAQQADQAGTSLPSSYRVLMGCWYALGVPAFLGVLLIYYLMVVRQLPW